MAWLPRRIRSAADAAAADLPAERLAMTPFSDSLQHDADLRLAIGGELVDEAVDRRAAVVVWSVPKTRWPVSAVSMAMADRLEVAHLADQHDVGVLAQRGAAARA